MKCRSTHQSYSVGKGVMRNFAKFTEKHLCQSLFFNKVAGLSLQLYLKETLAQVFSYEFCEVTKNNFFWKWLSSMQRRIQNSHSMKSVQNTEFFSGPYFHEFRLNTEIYYVNLCIWSEYGKLRTRKNSLFGHSSYSACQISKMKSFFTRVNDFVKLLKCRYHFKDLAKKWKLFGQTNLTLNIFCLEVSAFV